MTTSSRSHQLLRECAVCRVLALSPLSNLGAGNSTCVTHVGLFFPDILATVLLMLGVYHGNADVVRVTSGLQSATNNHVAGSRRQNYNPYLVHAQTYDLDLVGILGFVDCVSTTTQQTVPNIIPGMCTLKYKP